MQFRVPYTVYSRQPGLPPNWFPSKDGHLRFTDIGLARALLLTGRHHALDAVRSNPLGEWEYRHKVGFTRAYFESAASSHSTPLALGLTTQTGLLDPTEKGYLSYSIGQALTGIFCEHILSIPRMLHFDLYKEDYDLRVKPSGRRPDLFSRTPRRLVIAEAKGRTTDSLKAVETVGSNTIHQLSSVQLVHRSPPLTLRELRSVPKTVRVQLIGCVAMVAPSKKVISLHVFDHGGVYLNAPKLSSQRFEGVRTPLDYRYVTMDRFVLDFYSSIVGLIEYVDQDPYVEDGVVKVNLVGLGITVGLLEGIYRRITMIRELMSGLADEYIFHEPLGLTDEVAMILRGAELERARVSPDGTFIETEWFDDANER